MLIAKNRKALWNYEPIEKYLAGIKLKGYEAKAIREKNVSFEGSYVKLVDNKPYVINLHIGRYSKQSQDIEKQNPKRDRELLLNKNEILKITNYLNEKGKTVVPLALLLKNNLIKLEIAVVKGRKEFEKKTVAKEKQMKRDLEMYTKELRG